MMRHTGTFIAILKRALFIALLVAPVCGAHAVGLKENSIVKSDTITLGDIFYDLPRDEDRVLGNAPRPGQDMVLNARTLLRIAVALDLPWRPSSADQITLSRDATIIEYDQIKEALHTALYDEGVYGSYELSIPAEYHKIVLPNDVPPTMTITKFNVDPVHKTFEAQIAAPSSENPIQNVRVSGKMNAVIKVPVLMENLQAGQIIRANDISYVTIKERDYGHDTIADADALIGMTARRVVIAGRPIKATDLIAPQIVERGELVVMTLNQGVLNLSTQVKALENGAKGDIIRVVNTSSNQTLQAQVIGDNRVAVIRN